MPLTACGLLTASPVYPPPQENVDDAKGEANTYYSSMSGNPEC